MAPPASNLHESVRAGCSSPSNSVENAEFDVFEMSGHRAARGIEIASFERVDDGKMFLGARDETLREVLEIEHSRALTQLSYDLGEHRIIACIDNQAVKHVVRISLFIRSRQRIGDLSFESRAKLREGVDSDAAGRTLNCIDLQDRPHLKYLHDFPDEHFPDDKKPTAVPFDKAFALEFCQRLANRCARNLEFFGKRSFLQQRAREQLAVEHHVQ